MYAAAKKDLYAVLGARPSDSVQQLRHTYQKLALKYHPDRLGEVCPSDAEAAVGNFLEIHEAWRILSDENTRKQYDQQRRDECLYTHCCRCGGEFSISEEEVAAEMQRNQEHDDDEEEETKEGPNVAVSCDTCSLSMYITWSSNLKTQS